MGDHGEHASDRPPVYKGLSKARPQSAALSNFDVGAMKASPSRSSLTLDREGKTITQVGGEEVGVPIDLQLQHASIITDERSDQESSSAYLHSDSGWGHHDRQQSAGAYSDVNSINHNPPPLMNWPKSISFVSKTNFPPIKRLLAKQRKRILVSGGAGFVGSHLVDRLMCSGHDVIVLDNFFSGSKTSISHWVGHPNFELVRADVVEPFMLECDQIYHLACPASPKAYQANSIKTLKTNFMGTMNLLGLAKRVKARFLLSSTSEIYGSPEQHPQKETYWGHVNCVGPRACYDEGKRVAEALTYGYHRQDGVDVRVARIFNCYGPRMSQNDGRVVSNFIVSALRGEPIEIYGDGQQTRSLMYIHDLISGLIALMASDCTEPVNLGTEDESTVEDWAFTIRDTVSRMRREGELSYVRSKVSSDEEKGAGGHSNEEVSWKESEIVYKPAVIDDPPRRRPDITRAKEVLGWQPEFTTQGGIEETIRYFCAKEEEDV